MANAKTTALAAIEAATTEDEVTAAMTTFNNAIAACTTQAVADQIAQVMSEVSAKTGSGMTYTGSPIQLINTPTTALPDGYTMKYAVTTENTAPTDENLYTTSIPTGTEAGTYYVWYKVVGDDNHSDTTPASVTVTVMQESTIPGDIDGDGEVNAKDVTALRRNIVGGYGVELSKEVADLNKDSYVNAKDVSLLRRFLAGGYGVVLA